MAHLEPLQLLEHLRGEVLPEDACIHLEGCPRCSRTLDKLRRVRSGLEESEEQDTISDGRAAGGLAKPRGRRSLELQERAQLSDEGLVLAKELVEAAEHGSAEAVLERMREHPARGYVLSYAAQQGARLAVSHPSEAFHLSLLIKGDANVPSTAPLRRDAIVAEACLLGSQALLNQGFSKEAVGYARDARAAFGRAEESGMSEALCDYFEASALSYTGEHAASERLFKRAIRVFSEFGQEHWMGRAELGFAVLLAQRGNNARALEHLDAGIERLDMVEDANALTSALNNKASTLAHLRRPDEARATYAEALRLARAHSLHSLTHHIQLGLAEIDFLDGRYDRALAAYERLTVQARERGYQEQVRFALLYTAECLARLGQSLAAVAALGELRREMQTHPFQSVALEDLFVCLDKGDIDAGLIEAVRDHLENPEKPYQARRAG